MGGYPHPLKEKAWREKNENCHQQHNSALYFMMVCIFLWLFWGLIIIIRQQNNHKKIHTIMKYNAELCEQAVLISFAFLFTDIQSKPDYIVLPLLPVFLSTLAKDQYNTLKGIPQAFLCSTLSLQWWIQERGPGAPPPVIFRPN